MTPDRIDPAGLPIGPDGKFTRPLTPAEKRLLGITPGSGSFSFSPTLPDPDLAVDYGEAQPGSSNPMPLERREMYRRRLADARKMLATGAPLVFGEGLCGCGCGAPPASRKGARYATSACRTRDWKARRGITGIRYVKASQNGKPSGLQVAYSKLVSDIPDEPMSKEEVERWITSKLSTRQREQLERRAA